MSYRDSQRFRKVYGYYRPVPRPTDTLTLADNNYVNEVVAGIDWKQSVRVASTANINLVAPGNIDSIALVDEDRVLLKSQTATAENGIYIYYTATNTLIRSLDAEQDTLTSGAAAYVEEGTVNSSTAWILSTIDPITVGTTGLIWVLLSGPQVFIKSGSYAHSTVNVSFGDEFTNAIGSNIFFYVSGTIGFTNNPQISVFGGDLLTSGSLKVGDDVNAERFFIRIPESSLNSSPVGSITGSAQGIVLSSSQDLRFTVNSGSYNLATTTDSANYSFVFGSGSLVESILNAKYDGYAYYRKGFLFGSNITASGTLDVTSIGTLRPGWDDERDVDLFYNGMLLNDGSAITGDYEFIDDHTVLFNSASVGPFESGDIISVVIKNSNGAPYGMAYVPPPAVTMGGDVTGDSNSSTVVRIRSRAISSVGPSDGDVYIFNSSQNQWNPASTFTSPVSFTLGLSGSHTKLANGTSAFIGGSGITITSASNGAVTITSSGAGTPDGINTYIQFNDGGSFGGDSGLTYNKTSNELFVSGAVLIGTSSAPNLEIFVVNQILTSSGGTYSTMGSRFVSVLTGSELFSSHYGLINTVTSKVATGPGTAVNGQGNFAYHATTSSISNLWGYYNAAIAAKPDAGTTAGLLSSAVGDASVMGFLAAENFSGSITNAYGFRYNNTGINSNRTITNSFGMQILNVGAAAGVTNAIGLDIASINTASGIKLGIRTQDPIVIGSSNVVGSEKLRIVGDTRSEGTLTSVGNIMPDADTTYNLGSDSNRWANIYTGDLHLRNDRGDWTIVEEIDYLCVVNNVTGKKYKMMLDPIE
jgi:hypothetical protein